MWTLLQPFPERTPPKVTIFPPQRTPDMLSALGAGPLVVCLLHVQVSVCVCNVLYNYSVGGIEMFYADIPPANTIKSRNG